MKISGQKSLSFTATAWRRFSLHRLWTRATHRSTLHRLHLSLISVLCCVWLDCCSECPSQPECHPSSLLYPDLVNALEHLLRQHLNATHSNTLSPSNTSASLLLCCHIARHFSPTRLLCSVPFKWPTNRYRTTGRTETGFDWRSLHEGTFFYNFFWSPFKHCRSGVPN